MIVFAIDPGPERSAFLRYDTVAQRPSGGFGIALNHDLLHMIADGGRHLVGEVVAYEMIASYGMAVGREVFDTCVWIGRFIQACTWTHPIPVFRREVKAHLCHSQRATDANVRYALIDRFGPGTEKAIGTKKAPGPLFGIVKDMWSALAIAVTVSENRTGSSAPGVTLPVEEVGAP